MPSILSDLYYGNYAACERRHAPESEYVQALSEISELEDEIIRALTGDLKEKFLQYLSLCGKFNLEEGRAGFIEGFRCCARLVSDAVRAE